MRERKAFDDEEITIFIEVGGSWQRAVAEGAKALLADRARFARVWSRADGTVQESGDDTAGIEFLNGLIDRWGGGATSSTLPLVVVTNMGPGASDPRC